MYGEELKLTRIFFIYLHQEHYNIDVNYFKVEAEPG